MKTIDEFRTRWLRREQQRDGNAWWELSMGAQLNLFDEAQEDLEVLLEKLKGVST